MVAASQLGVNLPVTYLLNILACDSKVRGAQRLPRTGKVCGLIIWSVDEDEAVLNHPIFYLFSFAIEISISPAWRVAIEDAGDESVMADQWKSV